MILRKKLYINLIKKKYRASTQIPLGSYSDSIYARQLIENKNDLLKIDKTKMAAAASFSISHENGQY